MLKTFAKMLGLPIEAAEDALKSDRVARAVVSRRGFIAGATALLVQNKVFGFLPELSEVVKAQLYRSPWRESMHSYSMMASMLGYVAEKQRGEMVDQSLNTRLLAELDREPELLSPLDQQVIDQAFQHLQQGTYSF